MTNVIAFKPGRKRGTQPPAGPCKLFFFTGVRYMRRDETAKIKPRKSRDTKRKNRA